MQPSMTYSHLRDGSECFSKEAKKAGADNRHTPPTTHSTDATEMINTSLEISRE